MPRGGRGSGRRGSAFKGKNRHFTSEEELRAQSQREEKERQWRKQKGIEESDEEEEEEAPAASRGAPGELPPSSDSEEDEDDEEEKPKKGVEHLIQVANPNRQVKQTKKVTDLSIDDDKSKPQLSRREREAIQKQQARERYEKLHLEGKTDEAQADLARLAIIRKQREEAAKKREEEKKAAEAKAKAKS